LSLSPTQRDLFSRATRPFIGPTEVVAGFLSLVAGSVDPTVFFCGSGSVFRWMGTRAPLIGLLHLSIPADGPPRGQYPRLLRPPGGIAFFCVDPRSIIDRPKSLWRPPRRTSFPVSPQKFSLPLSPALLISPIGRCDGRSDLG